MDYFWIKHFGPNFFLSKTTTTITTTDTTTLMGFDTSEINLVYKQNMKYEQGHTRDL